MGARGSNDCRSAGRETEPGSRLTGAAAEPAAPVAQDPGHATDLTRSLLLKLRTGSAHAGTLLGELYRAPLLRFCWGYLGQVEDSEDAVQEVFCRVLGAADIPDNFRAWLYRVARNVCLNRLRDRARHEVGALPSESRLGTEQSGPLTRLVRREQRSRVVHLVGALPAHEREALRMRYVENLSRAEIAYILDVGESVVKSRIFEGLQHLRKHASLLE